MLNLSRSPRPGQVAGPEVGLAALLVPAALIVVLIWLPFGTALIASIEEWGMLGMFNKHGTFFVVHPDGPVALHAVRALMPSSFASAYELSPSSFDGWHAMQMIALLVKGVASTYLIWKATGSRFLAVVMGALVLVYPADTMQLSFRSIHINESAALALLAVAILVEAVDSTRRSWKWIASAFAALLFFLACAIYEAAITLVLAPLLLLYVRYGFRKWISLLRINAVPICIWFMGMLSYAGFAVWSSRRVASYQQSLANGEGGLFGILAHSFTKLFSVGALRSLLGGWVDSALMLSREFAGYSYVVVAAVLFGALMCFALRSDSGPDARKPDGSETSAVRSLRLAIVGLLLMLMGYAPFLLSQAHLAISQRTFIWATPGAAMVWVAIVAWLRRGTRFGAGAVAVVLLTLGLSAQLFQFHHYVGIAERQRALLKAIVENFDGNLGGRTLVVVDGTNQLGHTWMFLQGVLPDALSYLYGHKIGPVEICHAPSMEWHAADDLGRKGTCVRNEHGAWTFSYPKPVTTPGYVSVPASAPKTIAASDVQVLTIGADGSVSPDPALDGYRARLKAGSDTIDLRYRGVLDVAPWPLRVAKFRDEKPRDYYKWDFGDYWSLEIPTRGSGWREAEWEVGRFHHKAAAWKMRETSDLYFEFLPTASSYRLRGKFDLFAPGVKQEQMKILLNEHQLELRWVAAGELEADVPSSALKAGTNTLQVQLPVDLAYYGLSTRMDWIEIAKAR